MGKKRAVVRWMGLDSSEDATDDGSVPAWNGDRTKRRYLSWLIWFGTGVFVFVFFRDGMPANDGFGGYVPLILAVLVMACGLLATERYFLRSQECSAAYDEAQPDDAA